MHDVVHLTVPSSPRYAATVRYVAMNVTAIAGFDVDRVEDARLAVDEVFNALLSLQPPEIRCAIACTDAGFRAALRAVGTADHLLGAQSFGWTVLRALVTTVDITQDGSDACITLTMQHDSVSSP